MTLGGKIKLARKSTKQKFTQQQLADAIGVKRASITQYETDAFIPTVPTLKKISEICDVPMTFFFDDEIDINQKIIKKELNKNLEKYTDLLPAEYQPKNIVFIDKVEMVAGAGAEGAFDLELFNSSAKIGIDRSFIKGLNPTNLKLFEVVGDSMHPEYDEGDLAIVDMVNHRYNFIRIGGVYVIRMGDIVHIKRVEFLPHNTAKLMSLNPKYGDILPHKEGYEWEILGKVCGKIHYEIAKGLTFDDAGIR